METTTLRNHDRLTTLTEYTGTGVEVTARALRASARHYGFSAHHVRINRDVPGLHVFLRTVRGIQPHMITALIDYARSVS